MTQRFDWTSIVARILFSFFAVFAAYNPSGHSYWHWMQQGSAGFWAKLAVGMALLVLHIFIGSSTIAVLKWRGVLVVVAFLFAGWMALSSQAWLGQGGGSAPSWSCRPVSRCFTRRGFPIRTSTIGSPASCTSRRSTEPGSP